MSHKVMQMALETAEGIANANWREWYELASPEEFERWVKSRASHMATALREELAKPERQPLTTPQYVEVLGPLLYQVVCSAGTLRRIVRAIEAAHGIKEQP